VENMNSLIKKGIVLSIFVFLLFCQGCQNNKESNSQNDKESNNETVEAVEAVEADGILVKAETTEKEIDGQRYIMEKGYKLKVTYPVREMADEKQEYLASFGVSASGGITTTTDENGVLPYLLARTIKFPYLYRGKGVSKVDFTLYNTKAYFRIGQASSTDYELPMEVEGSMVTATADDADNIYIEMPQEMMSTTDRFNSYQQKEVDEDQYFCDTLNNALIGALVYYNDGSKKQEYYKMETLSKYYYSEIDLYKLSV